MTSKTTMPEEQRLETLMSQAIMDTPDEEAFDRVTRLATRIFGTPMSLVSLLDDKRQWFKSKQGLDVCETEREIAVCHHAICGTETFVVLNLREDPRFAKNPLVTGEPKLAFYAGMPLIMPNGAALGTLCVLDTKPRYEWSNNDDECLKDLADIVLREIEIRSLGRDALSFMDRDPSTVLP